ncbi:MAG: ABC transporter substrate-binding protein [Thermomicrobiales bacterium]|nr:ABC transporter substrate-binding protein [Thermomicrobiales bacterium]
MIEKDLLRERVDRRTLIKGAGAAGIAGMVATPTTGMAAPGATSGVRLRAQSDPATLVVAAAGSPSDLDPHSSYDYQSVMAILGAYEGLIGLKGDSTTELEGIIAESWESNEDFSTWTFKIRPGITFQDGSPVDAEAVRLNYERFLTLGLGPVAVLSRFVSDPARITAPDESTVVFDLGSPQPIFPLAIASTYGPLIVNAKLLREHEEDGDWGHYWAQTNAEGTGSGPYRITNFEPGQILEMERFDDYWRGWDGNHFDKVIVRVVSETETRRQLLEQGEADIVDALNVEAYDALVDNPDITIQSQFVTRNQYFAMTVAGPLETPEARQAMNFAWPWTDVLEGVYGGRSRQPRGPVPPEIRGHDENTLLYTTDLERARTLLEAAGVEEGTQLTLAMQTGLDQPKAAAELFQQNLAQLGIDLTIDVIDLSTYTSLVYGDAGPDERPNLMWWGWWPDYNDAWNHLYPQVSCDAQDRPARICGLYATIGYRSCSTPPRMRRMTKRT